MARLVDAVNARLMAIGVPPVTLRLEAAGGGALGSFDIGPWTMQIGQLPEDGDDVLAAAHTIWHEARHAEQAFLGLRYLASRLPHLLTPELTAVHVPQVLQAARDNPAAPGFPEREAGRYWVSAYYGDGDGIPRG